MGELTDITLTDNNDKLVLVCNNSITTNPRTTDTNYTGIGMANTLRRLELKYPNLHIINVVSDNQYYCVTLEIKLK